MRYKKVIEVRCTYTNATSSQILFLGFIIIEFGPFFFLFTGKKHQGANVLYHFMTFGQSPPIYVSFRLWQKTELL